jgi:amino acid adenylation domain-containing protein
VNVAHTLPALIEASARSRPDAVAIADGARLVSYGELGRLMHRLASALAAAGVSRGDRVGILMPKSADAVIALLGAMRAGAAYVPIDPGAPMRRARAILADAGVSALVAAGGELARREGLLEGDGAPRPRVIVQAGDAAPVPAGIVSLALERVLDEGTAPLPDAPGATDLAYILYTSGSTGQPKGVMLTHANALAFVLWAVEETRLTSEDRLSSHAPFHFDLSVFDLYGAFAAGASLHLVPSTLSYFPLPLARWIAAEGITVWYSVPSILGRMAEQKGFTTHPGPLRTVIFAGEVFPIPALRALQGELPHTVLYNWFGPTETNVCTSHRVQGPIPETRREPLPIGRPCPFAEVRIVDPDGREVPRGGEGELWVAGDSVLRGYWNDPERTTRALVPDPRDAGSEARFYRTGDVVREAEDGSLTFLGRRDAMVKVRGYRVELGDIEAALFDHPSVADAAAFTVPGDDGQLRLVAAVVRRAGTALEEIALQRHCVERIPRYMVPESITWLDALPRTSTGKVDRLSLAERLGNAGAGT